MPRGARKTELEKLSERCASLATHNNPVSVFELGTIQIEARRLLLVPFTEEQTVERLRVFIRQLRART